MTANTLCYIGGDDESSQIERYAERMRLLRQVILSECGEQVIRSRREIISSTANSSRQQLERLQNQLIDCLKGQTKVTTDIQTTTDEPSTTTSNIISQPAECLTAINFTETWRLDHNGSFLTNKDREFNCDTKSLISQGRPWFRFSGGAGSRLLTKCVPAYSCGTVGGMWSDDADPTTVGVSQSINLFVSAADICKYDTYKGSVLRCSDSPDDLIYKYEGRGLCVSGFCGQS